LRWGWDCAGGGEQKATVQTVSANSVDYQFNGTRYQLKVLPSAGVCEQLTNGVVRIAPNAAGKLVLLLGGF